MTEPAVLTVLVLADAPVPEALQAAWTHALPAAIAARIARTADAPARRRSLLGIRLVAHGLARLGHPPEALATLRPSANGRPSLDLPIDFSVAHCEGRVVCALSEHGPVGVDVEAIGDAVAGDFRLYLSPAERAWAGDDPRRFHALWTRKEALAKASGDRGLAAMRGFEVVRGTARIEGRRWRTVRVPVGRGFVAHAATAAARSSLRVEHVTSAAIVEGIPSPSPTLG